jgi:hypothetical protein
MGDVIEVLTTATNTVEVAATGPQGAPGVGVPTGGSALQVLRKVSSTNYDTEWAAAASGSGSVTSVALAGTGLSISGSPVTTSGTITANVSYGTTAGTACEGNDSRLTNARTPSAHASSHAAGGSDALTPSSIGAGRYQLHAYAFSSADQTITDTITVTGKTVISLDWGYPDGSGDCVYDLTVVGGALGDELIIVGTADIAPGFTSLSVTITLDNPGVLDPISITSGDLYLFARYVRGISGQWVDLAALPDNLEPADNGFRLVSSADATKKVAFEVDGLTTETTRTLTVPDSSGTIALTQQAADYEVTESTNGIILKSPNNTRWRLTINDDGTLSRAALALMTLLAFATSGFSQVRDMVTDTNGNIVTGRTNVLTFSNRVSIPISSGAATTNSLLTADGAGGSSFVVSRTVTRFTTNDQTKTNWGFNVVTQPTNNDPQMGSWSLDANSFYRVEYAVAWVATTNSGFAHGIAFSTNLSEFNHRTGVGQAANTSVSSINAATNATTIVLANVSAASSGGRFAVAGFVYVLTSSNANTMNYRWYPINNSADASTLVRSSMVSVTKMSP